MGTDERRERVRAAILASPLIHWASCVRVQTKSGKVERVPPNVLQRRMSEAFEALRAIGLAVRLLVLKPRQVGCSTFTAQLMRHAMLVTPGRGIAIADDYGNADNLMALVRHGHAHDDFPWGIGLEGSTERLEFSNGSTLDRDTAQNPRAGISATRQYAWMSEAARWPRTGVRSDVQTATALLNSVADVPTSLVVAETTAEGASGWFFDMWGKAAGLDALLDGKEGEGWNGWVKVFAAWHEFENHRRPVTEAQAEAIERSLTSREMEGRKAYGWTVEQIAWRRWTIATKCGGSESLFDQDYPEDDMRCFLTSGRPRFNQEGLRALKWQVGEARCEDGILGGGDDSGQTFVVDASGAWLRVWERPRYGYRYLVVVDPATGAEFQRGADPDRHSALVLRCSCVERDGVRRGPGVVARVVPPCRVDDDLLAEWVRRMSLWYGGCLVVPERNMGISIIKRLRDWGVPLFVMEQVDRVTGQERPYYGYETTASGKRLAVEALAALVRGCRSEDGARMALELNCAHALDEMGTFVVNADGGCSAAGGRHDDDVMALAIGLACEGSGTLMVERARRRSGPRDRSLWGPRRRRAVPREW